MTVWGQTEMDTGEVGAFGLHLVGPVAIGLRQQAPLPVRPAKPQRVINLMNAEALPIVIMTTAVVSLI